MAFQLPETALQNPDKQDEPGVWDTKSLLYLLSKEGGQTSSRTLERALNASGLLPQMLDLDAVRDEYGRPLNVLVRDGIRAEVKKKRQSSLILQQKKGKNGFVLMAHDARRGRKWRFYEEPPSESDLLCFIRILAKSYERPLVLWPHDELVTTARKLVETNGSNALRFDADESVLFALTAYGGQRGSSQTVPGRKENHVMEMSHLDRLEAESIHIIREVMAEAENPVMLYSIGKDSSVMLRLAEKAFYPSKPPFPLLHVDTRWKFQAMYEFRSQIAQQTGMELLVHINPEGVEKDINPFDHGSSLHTDIMKTQSLKMALDKYKFDVAFGGARRDEEKSRAKERVFSFRTDTHRWDPKNQRPELWNLYNGRKNPGESIRVFPLSNWTELDIWEYIYRENIPIVPLYYAAERPVIERDGMLMMVDDDRLKLFPGEKIKTKRVRFRTLGCYPLTGAVESDADDLPKILLELLEARTSERQGRAIDTDSAGSMEKKKQEGYF